MPPHLAWWDYERTPGGDVPLLATFYFVSEALLKDACMPNYIGLATRLTRTG
jgi:hypothetical protein